MLPYSCHPTWPSYFLCASGNLGLRERLKPLNTTAALHFLAPLLQVKTFTDLQHISLPTPSSPTYTKY